jgi:hypothetical protein
MTRSLLPSGSAFIDNDINNTRPLSVGKNQTGENLEKTNFVTFTAWCEGNFISKKVGVNLIKRKLLIAIRYGGKWYVAANCEKECYQQLLDYLGVEKLLYDADNQCDD